MLPRHLRFSLPDRIKSVQVAAAVAMALSSAKDRDIQDSARHLTAIPPLVEMAAGYCAPAAEVGRLTLLALRHRNERNAEEVSAAMRRRGMSLDECFLRVASGGIPATAQLRCCSRLTGLIQDLEDELVTERNMLTPRLSGLRAQERVR